MVDGLRDARTGEPENRDAIFRRANGRDTGVHLVLMPAPGFHVHCWADDELRALPHEFVRDARVAQVIADAKADHAPRRVPDGLVRRGQAVVKELDWDAFDLLEDYIAIGADDEGGVVIILWADGVFAAMTR